MQAENDQLQVGDAVEFYIVRGVITNAPGVAPTPHMAAHVTLRGHSPPMELLPRCCEPQPHRTVAHC